MESIEIKSPILISVIRSVRILSLVGLVLGSVSLIAGIGFSWPIKELFILTVVIFFSIILLIISEGLSKKKGWAWYLGISISAIGFICAFFVNPLFKLFIGVISGLIFLGLLYYRKEYLKTKN